MIIEKLEVGMIMANCFIVGCDETKQAAVIDPGDESERILRTLASHKLTVKYIINTHGHFDHVGANKQMKEATGAELLIHADDAPMLSGLTEMASAFGMASENSPPPDRTIGDGDRLTVGNFEMSVIHTPGHSPGGISLFTDNTVFVGDTLFAGSIGRTDFPGGDFNTLISVIQNKLFPLGDDIRVCCGHGPETTIGTEKRTNPFVMMR
ncbi:MAG: MBL fold metallo-hydrolase [Thermodesulfobacteriota bacterium]|nr:MBL fold metallo-hydrolase [Thermodesulfobacteriota bacterium]